MRCILKKIIVPAIVLISLFLLSSCGQRDEEVLDPDIENDTVLRAQLLDSKIVSSREDSDAGVTYLTYRTLSPTPDIETLDTDQKFVCVLKKSVDAINSEIERERTSYRVLHERLNNSNLSDEDEYKMIELLVKYRLIDKNHYFSPSSYTAEQIENKIKDKASSVYEKQGVPRQCKYSYQYYYTDKNGKSVKGYKITAAPLDSDECLEAFLNRAQVIPTALVLSQAALESGWGSSRFALEGNNLFGLQYRFSSREELLKRPHCMSPSQSSTRCVFKFVSINDAIKSYYGVLNAGTYQTSFRLKRGAGSINPNNCDQASKLILGLDQYAEEGNYFTLVRETMGKVCPLIDKCE